MTALWTQFSALPFSDMLRSAVDIGILAYVIYHILLLVRGTRAVQMAVGLLFIVFAYLGSRVFHLATVNWVLENFLSSFVVLVIIVFQADIRRGLVHFGQRTFLDRLSKQEKAVSIEEVTRAADRMAQGRVGAIIVLERAADLTDYVQEGVAIDAKVSREILQAIFHTRSPIHDGAVVIQKGRVAAAGVFLPLSTNPSISKALGTRHRAAIGITEEVDAVTVVVSEETGKISLVVDGQITRGVDPPTLRKVLTSQFASQFRIGSRPKAS